MQVASFLRRELPIRLAHRIQDLQKVPLMKDMESVKVVKQLYIQSFLDLVEFDKKIINLRWLQKIDLNVKHDFNDFFRLSKHFQQTYLL